MNKRLGATALVVAAIAAAAGLLASTSSGAAKAQQTIGLIEPGPGSTTAPEEESGAQAAASALGYQLAITSTDDASAQIDTIQSLIAEHAAAIMITSDSGAGAIDAVLPALAQARKAGIPTLSLEQQYPGSVWVNPSSPTQLADALADSLASQMKQRGRFVIVPCTGALPIVGIWLKDIKFYARRHYPHMRRVGVVYGGTGNGPAGTLKLRPVLKKYPHLRGLIFLCPSESYTVPPQIVHAHKVGKIFSAGIGGDCPPLYIVYANSVRAGSAEMVCPGNYTNLGYLAIWAADHLARSNTLTLTPGNYDVGGPVGTVQYYNHNQELRLGQPLTITKANVDQYTG